MADPIIVQMPDGQTVEFPAGFTPERIEFELKRYERTKPPETVVGKVGAWAGTRGAKAATGLMETPAALEGLGAAAGAKIADWTGLPKPPPKEAPGPFDTAAITGQLIKRWLFDRMPETNLPGKVGKVTDAAVEAVLTAPMMGGGWGSLIPAATGGAGSEIAGQLTEGTPYEPWARLAGGVAGGGAGALGQTGVRYAWDAGKTLVEPFYQGGRDAIVGRALNKAASDPKTAVARMQGSQPTVPGSNPTAAQAANDPGLLATENALKGRVGDQFATRTAEANAGRMAAIDKVAPTVTAEQAGDTIRGAIQGRRDALTAARSAQAGPLYDKARAAGGTLDAKPILDSINKSIMQETGPIRMQLQRAKGALYIGEGETKRLATDVSDMQAVRRALDAQIGAVRDNPTLKGVLVGIRNQVDDALKLDANFRLADETFRKLSEPLRPFTPEYGPRVAKALEKGPYQGPYVQPSEVIPDAFLKRGTAGVDEMLAATGLANQPVRQAMAGRLIDDFKAAIRTTADDPLGNKVLSAAAADKWLQANKDVVAKVMTKDQVKALQTIVDDFAVGARRPQGVAGSNTAQNLASGNMLNAILRFRTLADSTAAQNIVRPLQFLYRLPEEVLQDALLKAMMDPKVASALMVKASQGNAKLLAPMLEQSLVGGTAGVSRAGEPILNDPRIRATR